MPKQNRKIGFWLSTSLVVGNMTGSGIFLLPAALAVYGGISLFGWLFTILGSLFLAIVFARLSRIIKKPGGPYAYTREGFGDFPGFLVMWGYWISIWCGNAAIAVAGVGYLSVFIPLLQEKFWLSALVAIGAIWIFTYVNTWTIRSVAWVQLITTILKILPLLLLGIFGLVYLNMDHFKPMNLSGLSDFKAVTATAALTLWAFLGLESATIPSDNVKNPGKTIPRATIAGLLIAALMYVSSSLAIMGIIAPEDLQNSTAPFADAAKTVWGNWAYYLIAAGAVISCFGALNGWILLQGRLPLAAARDKLFPKVFARLTKKGTPLVGITVASILASLLVGINYTRGLVDMFTFIIMLSTLTCLLPYLLSSVSELMLYFKKAESFNRKRLFTSIGISVPAFLYSLWAISGLGLEIILWGIMLLALGIPIFIIIKKKGNSYPTGSN